MIFKRLRQRIFARREHGASRWITTRLRKHLDLDATQQAKFERAQSELFAARAALHEERKLEHAVAGELLTHERLDRSRVQQLIERFTYSLREHAERLIPAIGDFYDSLTPGQREQVHALWSRGASFRHGRGRC